MKLTMMAQLEQMDWSPSQTIAAILAVILIGYVLFYVVYERFFSPYRRIPGPFLAKFTRLWEVYQMATDLPDQVLLRLHAEHGPVVRVGPNKFTFNEPADARIIYSLKTNFPKSEFYKALGDPNRPSVFSTRDDADHTERKRKIAGLYSMSTMINYEPAVDQMIQAGAKKLSEFAESQQLMPMDKFFHYFAFDLIVRITYNRDLGFLERFDDLNGLMSNIEKVSYLGPILGVLPEMIPWFGRIGKMRGKKKSPGIQMVQSNRMIIEEVRKDHIVAAANAKAEPFAYKCFALEAAGKLTPESTLDACGSNTNAGSDTIGSTLTALFWHLYNDPSSLARLRQEIDEGASNGLLSSPITFQEASNLPYLQAVVKEALRLSPSITFPLPRIVPAGGAELGDHYFPAGAEVGVYARTLHLNERYHGSDCTNWRPERWLESDIHNDDKSMASSLAFGAGKRVCLGRNIAMLEMVKLVPELVRSFDFKFEKDGAGRPLEPVRSKGVFMWMRYRCRVSRRLS